MERRSGVLGSGHTRAKFILMGEHSVVYGRPAIALPLPALAMDVEIFAVPGPARIASDLFTGALADAPADLAGPVAAIDAASRAFDVPLSDVTVAIESTIPAERGLGSSAATAGAIVHAFADAAGRRIGDVEHFDLVQVAERVAHGTPSGLDAVATNSRVPVLFRGGVAQSLPMSLDATFVIADTGVRGRTRDSVASVRAQLAQRPEWTEDRIDRLGVLAEGAVGDLGEGAADRLGARMAEAHGILAELGVSSDELDALVRAASSAGAVGAKLTGGGRGGCVVALTNSPAHSVEVADALIAAGAHATWTYDTMVPIA
ncbi:mevalonate kinase [Labedella gwakjiensis]|uniref:Mevalonate kinase n=1 Tax=Labedella gwakjiensis TaxID=390269 RepID=A0A2P8H0I9_9MICO|nr:mevalonate kinase [Labedella gwakjiensis]PSL39733.1 mevalonate kinase [Labedella gwakjiensis]RUQ85882.1 mevalonate kinase [Labedella gwakjiensis]